MCERGYADLNMDDLASQVGISKPTLYQHFKNKDDLVAQVLIRSLDMFEEYVQRPSDLRPIERIEEAFRVLLYERYKPDGILANLGSEVIGTTMSANPQVAARKAQVMRHLEVLVDAAKERGEIVSDIPSRLITCTVYGFLGLVSNPRSDLVRLADEVGLDYFIDSLVSLVLHGIVKPDVTDQSTHAGENPDPSTVRLQGE